MEAEMPRSCNTSKLHRRVCLKAFVDSTHTIPTPIDIYLKLTCPKLHTWIQMVQTQGYEQIAFKLYAHTNNEEVNSDIVLISKILM